MPALDFPANPVIGDQYNDWVWNGGQWDFRQTLPGGLPAGAIIQWGGATAPVNWLLCDGSAVSRTTYASLFAAIGTTYGTGNGTTTFNLPDLRGRVPVGKNGGSFGTLGATGGAETHTLTAAQLPSITGDVRLHGGESGSVLWQPNGVFSTSDIRSNEYKTSGGVSNGASSVGPLLRFNNGGQGQAHNNLQPYQVVNYIIKATAAVTPGESELAPRVGALEATNSLSQNYLINGAFDVWQRGSSGFTSGYFADRWFLNGANSGSRSTDVPNSNFTYSASATNSSSAYAGITQRIESIDAKNLVGKIVTVSGWFKRTGATNGGTVNINMDYPTAVDNYAATTYVSSVTWSATAPASSWVKYSATFTVPVPPGAINGLQFSFTHNGSAGNSLGGLWAGLQVEEGPVSTTFRRNAPSTQAEFAACQRYYQRVNAGAPYSNLGAGCTNSTSQSSFIMHLPVETRIRGTITSTAANTFGSHIPGIEVAVGTSFVNLSQETTRAIWITINHNASGNFGSSRACAFITNNNTGAWIAVDCEL